MLRYPTLPRCLALSLSLALADRAAAQSVSDPESLPTVVVAATGFAQPLAQALPSVSVLTRDEIAASGAANLDTLLQQLTGVQLTTSGGPGQAANVFVRGFAGPDVLVLLDGVPMNAQDSTGVAYLNNLGTDQIERVEIVRGNVSAIYGAGAIGGVVLITTRAAGATPQASVSLSAGSRGSYTSAANASGEVGSTQLQAGISRETTQGVSAINPGQYPLANPNANGYGNTTESGSIVQQLAPGQSLGVRGFSSVGRASYDSYIYAAPTDTNLSSTTQQLGQIFSDNRINAAWTSHLTLSQQASTNTIANFSAYPFTSSFRTRVQQLLWRNVVELGAGWTATGGVDLQQQSIASATGDMDAVARNVDALFAGVAGSLGASQLQLNLRHDATDGYAARDTGYLGYGLELGQGWKAIADYSSAFNAAPLGYLDAPYYGNPDLQPETAHSAEAGLQWQQGRQLWRATLFQTSASQQWQYDYTTSTFQNLASTLTRGLELSGQGSWLGWAGNANLTLQQPLNRALPGQPTLQRNARSLGNLVLEREDRGVTWGAAWHYTGARWDDDGDGQPVTLGAYSTLDLHAGGELTPQWSWNARVQNLFDKQYQTVWGYNREPLGVFLGLTWHLPGA